MRKLNRRRIIIALLVCILLLLVTTTFAWFVFFTNTGIKSGDSVSVNVGGKIEIKFSEEDETTWTNKLTLKNQRLDLLDISGDGKNFFYPTSLDKNDEPRDFIEVGEDISGYYIEFSLDFRSSLSLDLFLGDTSFVKENGNTASIFNQNLNSDAICGATRVAFLEKVVNPDNSVEEELKCIWIPNDDYYLYVDESGLPKVDIGNTSKRESSYYYYTYDENNDIVKKEYSYEDYWNGKVVIGKNIASESNNKFGYCKPLLSLDNKKVKTLIVRLWFEGTDRECSAYLSHGGIKYNFDFFGAFSKESQSEIIDTNTIYAKGESSETVALYADDAYTSYVKDVEYSTDGIIWNEYINRTFDTNVTTFVYLRVKETDKKLPGKCIRLDLSNPIIIPPVEEDIVEGGS